MSEARLIAGVGFHSGATPMALETALAFVTRGRAVEALATAPSKVPALVALAQGRWPVIGVEVAGVETPTQSTRSAATHGTGSVAEAAALQAARARGQARLLGERQITNGVSLALAQILSSEGT